jgi:hypothetical protein
MPPRRPSKKDSPKKLAGRMKRRWRVVLLRNNGEILGEVEASLWRRPRRQRWCGLISMKSGASGLWCRSLADAPRGKYIGERLGERGRDDFKYPAAQAVRCEAED